MKLAEPISDLLAQRAFAWVTTLRRDGSAHSTVVWVGVDHGVIVFTTVVGRVKERNLRRDPRVVISVLDQVDGYRFASIAGTAAIGIDDVDAIRLRLTQKYRGSDARPVEISGEDRVVVRVTPVSVISHGL